LIPTSGINGADEQERRATSALLAVVASVKEFGRTMTRRVGAPAGRIETFVEVPFETEGRTLYPDGLIRVTRGSKSWTALVEVKTGTNQLQAQQLETYLDIAKREGFDAVVTISNEIVSSAGEHPTLVDKRKLRKVELHHLSWTQILSDAVMEKTYRGVADPDQAWILGELIRYLEHPKSGALEFDDMGQHWVDTRNAARAGTLRSSDAGSSAITARFDQLLRFISLRLGRELGTDVQLALSRAGARDPAVVARRCSPTSSTTDASPERCESPTRSGRYRYVPICVRRRSARRSRSPRRDRAATPPVSAGYSGNSPMRPTACASTPTHSAAGRACPRCSATSVRTPTY
jgi:hypothetical protein